MYVLDSHSNTVFTVA